MNPFLIQTKEEITLEDNEIIELYWQRSQRAITETDGKYGGRLQTLSMNILHDRQDAEECVNDTYHATWNTLPPQRPNYFCVSGKAGAQLFIWQI